MAETGPSDYEIVNAMRVYGGSFCRTLAVLCDFADEANFSRIKATWPEYWADYADIAVAAKEREAENNRAV